MSLQYVMLAETALGRTHRLDSLITAQLTRGNAPPAIVAYYRTAPRVVLGVISDDAAAAEAAAFTLMATTRSPNAGVRGASAQIAPTLIFGLRLPRTEWPAIDSIV